MEHPNRIKWAIMFHVEHSYPVMWAIMFHVEHLITAPGQAQECSTWNTFVINGLYASDGMFHVEHRPGGAGPVIECSTWNINIIKRL